MSDMPVVIRKEYLMLMDGDHCAAAILNAFEMWSKNKPTFIYKSMPEMQTDLMGLFGLNRIGEAFKKLRERGFLVARNNPAMAADRTLQYQFQPVTILQAALRRMLMSLKHQTLRLMFQALILKHQALGLNDESECISESKSEIKSEVNHHISDSRERDAAFEGVDQYKFIHDDPMPAQDSVPSYLHQQPISSSVRQQLTGYMQKLGLERYAETMRRCSNARSWEYVLKALANESLSPRSVAPPSQVDWEAEARKYNGNRMTDEQRLIAEMSDEEFAALAAENPLWKILRDPAGSTDTTEHDLDNEEVQA